MENLQKNTCKKILGGVIIGIVNGLFGAGGGIIAVPILKKSGMEDKTAHASSVAVILPVSVFTLSLYLLNGRVEIAEGLKFIPLGILGALLGTKLLTKISTKWLRRVFGILIIIAGVRLFFR